MRIRTGDTVEVISGDDRGKQGKVLSVNPKSQRLIIEGINFMKQPASHWKREQTLLFQLCLPADSVGSALNGVS